MRWYAIDRAGIPGVYNSWSKCQEQLNGYNNNFQGFNTREEVEEDYLQFPSKARREEQPWSCKV
jgi:viroplasmin and RNaseH domain-containing protein